MYEFLGVSALTEKFVKTFQPSLAFHKGTNHLICSANQVTGSYMKFNSCLKWV